MAATHARFGGLRRSAAQRWLLALIAQRVSTAPTTWPITFNVKDPAVNASNNRFGTVALSASATCALIGARASGIGTTPGPGTVYGLSRASAGVPFAGTPVVLPAGPSSREAGTSLALSARCELAAVGAPSSSGRVYLYTPCGATWCLSATIAPPAGLAGFPTLGNAVALSASGATLVVGASNTGPATGGSGNGYGAVVVCDAPGGAITAAAWSCAKLPIATAASDWLGYAVTVDGAGLTLAASAPFSQNAGKVWVTARASAAAPWDAAAVLPDACGLAGSNRNFGKSLAMSDDGATIVVGAPRGGAQRGAAVVFDRAAAGGTWACTALLQPAAGSSSGDCVGTAVAISADGLTALVTACLRYAFVFKRATRDAAAAWVETGVLPAPDLVGFNNAFGDTFAAALSADGASALVGSPGTLSASLAYRGNATFYDAPPSATASPTVTPSATPSASPSASTTPSAPESGAASATPSTTATDSDSGSLTASATPTPSTSPSAAAGGASASASATPSATRSATPSATPRATAGGVPGPAGAAAAASAVGPVVGGSVGGVLLVGGAAAAAAAVLSSRRRAARLAGRGVPEGALAVGHVNPLSKAAGAAAPSVNGAPLAGAAVTWQRHADGVDVWYTSSNGDTEWDLPAGAVMAGE